MTLKVLDLFSGIGGFSLGLERAGMETVAFCEIEPFCQNILKKHWPEVPIAKNIKELHYKSGILYDADTPIYEGDIDLICGGFPCQPFSIAGRKKGTADDRDLWPDMFRLIKQVQPTWVIGENVAHFTKMAFFRTKTDLESEDCRLQPFIIPACAIGAPHKRDRLWLIAHAQSKRCDRRRENGHSQISKRQVCTDQQDHRQDIRSKTAPDAQLCSTSANSDGQRCCAGGDHWQEGSVLHDQDGDAKEGQCSGQRRQCRAGKAGATASDTDLKRVQGIRTQSLSGEQAFSWCQDIIGVEDYFNRPDIPEPLIRRGDDGFSSRVDRLKALGNSIVPKIPEIIGEAIINMENQK